jgi:hypothetical protein
VKAIVAIVTTCCYPIPHDFHLNTSSFVGGLCNRSSVGGRTVEALRPCSAFFFVIVRLGRRSCRVCEGDDAFGP